MHMHIYTCMYIYTYAYAYIHMHVHIYICIYTCTWSFYQACYRLACIFLETAFFFMHALVSLYKPFIYQQKTFYLLFITIKVKHISIKSGCVVWVVKDLNETGL